MTQTWINFVFPATRKAPEAPFPQFSRLPAELQHKVWQETLPPSRIVQISFSEARGAYISNTCPPLALSICHHSRRVALSRYKNLDIGPSPSPIPFDFNIDRLYISNVMPLMSTRGLNFLISLSEPPLVHHLRWLYLDLMAMVAICSNGYLSLLPRMSMLEQVRIVVAYSKAFRGGALLIHDHMLRRGTLYHRQAQRIRDVRERVGIRDHKNKKDTDELKSAITYQCVFLTRDGKMI